MFTWSAEHNDCYFATFDVNRRVIYVWLNQMNPYLQDKETGTKYSVEWIWNPTCNDSYFITYYANGSPFYIWRKRLEEVPRTTGTGLQQTSNGQLTYNYGQQTHENQSQPYQSPRTYQVAPAPSRTSPPMPLSSQYGGQRPQPTLGASSQHDSYSPHVPAHSMQNSVFYPTPQTSPLSPREMRPSMSDLIRGTPERGSHETLDPSYRIRTGREAHQFFKRGRVFAMLYAELASDSAAQVAQAAREAGLEDPSVYSFTQGRFGETIYSNIRRFVIVRVRRRTHLVYACPITTYSGRGTMKNGCLAQEHTIVYLTGTSPTILPGEYEKGMRNEPIEIVPTDPNETMDPESRLRFGKIFPIEWNVKLRDIGQVKSAHMPRLLQYFRDADPSDEE